MVLIALLTVLLWSTGFLVYKFTGPAFFGTYSFQDVIPLGPDYLKVGLP